MSAQSLALIELAYDLADYALDAAPMSPIHDLARRASVIAGTEPYVPDFSDWFEDEIASWQMSYGEEGE